MSKPARPDLKLATFDALLADARHLLDGGYDKAGAWDLGMVLDHVAKSVNSPFDPKAAVLPLPVRPLFRLATRAMVKTGYYPTLFSFPAPKSMRPTPGIDAHAAYAELQAAIDRVNTLPGDTVKGPPLGEMKRDAFVGLQLLHAAHHLSFLKPAA